MNNGNRDLCWSDYEDEEPNMNKSSCSGNYENEYENSQSPSKIRRKRSSNSYAT